VGILHVGEIKAGTLDRSLVAGVSFRHILTASFLCEAVIIIFQLLLMYLILYFAFKFVVVGSLVVVVLISILMGLVGVSVGK